jgi:DNA recombination protein RmuC
VARLTDRVGNLRKHFDQVQNDLGEIETSAEKVARRARQIVAVEFDDPPAPPA